MRTEETSARNREERGEAASRSVKIYPAFFLHHGIFTCS